MKPPSYFFDEGILRIPPVFFARSPRLLSLDFDGTFVETASSPALEETGEGMRVLLGNLLHLPETRVVVLSGRSVPDLRKKVRVPGLIYAGNHGMDFYPSLVSWGISALGEWIRATREARDRLDPVVKRWPGAFLEAKVLDLSVHFRLLKPARVQELISEVLEAVQELPLKHRWGKDALEIEPEGAPGKVEALERLANACFEGKEYKTLVHIGGDPEDEGVFQNLQFKGEGALGLKVGEGATWAHFRLTNLREVREFLELFLHGG